MSNKLFSAGLAGMAVAATSLLNVSNSQAEPLPVIQIVLPPITVQPGTAQVSGFSFTTGNSQTGPIAVAGSIAVAAGPGASASSSSNSMATPTFASASTSATASNGNGLTASGSTGSSLSLLPGGAVANASARAFNNGYGASFADTKTNTLSTPGYAAGASSGNFGSAGVSLGNNF
jgi:hypothetical protein